ncbi:MAG: glycosyltransferase family 4 protein [Vicinamibacterales bacterium]
MSLRVLHVTESLAAGGIETTFLHVLRAMRALDADAHHHVLALAGGPLEGAYRDAATSVTIAPRGPALRRVLETPVDVVQVLFERCAYQLMPALLGRGTPVVYAKGYDMGGMYRLNEGFDWQADLSMLAAADAVTFTTPDLAAGYPLPAGRAFVLRKAADVKTFAALNDPDPGARPRILCVANLHPRKRLGDLVLALAEVRRHVPTADVRLVGGGQAEEAARLQSLARTLGMAQAVSIAGLSRDVRTEMAQASVVALPSSCEGVPTALLEGMAAGRPVVATRVGHVASIVDDGVEGFLVEVGDVPALADRLVRLLTHPSLHARMGVAARRRAAAHDVPRVAAHLLGVLQTTVAAGDPLSSLVVGPSTTGAGSTWTSVPGTCVDGHPVSRARDEGNGPHSQGAGLTPWPGTARPVGSPGEVH